MKNVPLIGYHFGFGILQSSLKMERFLVAFISLALASNISAEWSKWDSFGECSTPCGGGLANKTRTCLGASHTCSGTSIRYKLCNTQSCDGDNVTLRDLQCQSYNNVSIQDNYFHWVANYSADEPCVLFCKTVETGFVLKMQHHVLNGTECHQGEGRVCIAGKCKVVGCDGIVGSRRSLDSCGVCGGEGKSCDLARDHPRPRDHNRRHATNRAGKYHWHVVWGACSKSCGEGIQTGTLVCQKSHTGDHVMHEHCAKLQQLPPPTTKACTGNSSCMLGVRWHAFKWGSCSRTCGEGFKYRRVLCLKHVQNRDPKQVSDRKCKDTKPRVKAQCNLAACPEWLTGPWSPCSAVCGYGEQKRKVVCRAKSADSCKGVHKPDTVQKCYAGQSCEGDSRSFQKDDSSVTKHDFFDDARLQEMFTFPQFQVSQWGPCSVTCGVGYRHRNVTCRKGDHVVSIEDCEGFEPHRKKECHAGKCPQSVSTTTTFSWQHRKYKPCSQTCGKGTQSSILECIDMRSNRTVLDFLCDGLPRPNPITRYCGKLDCPLSWKVSEYSACSVPCGGGRQSRDIDCVQVTSYGGEVSIENKFRCPDPVPLSQRSCNLQFCQAEWSTGNWGECSVTCGLGHESRSVFCVKLIKTGLQVNVSDSECFGPRPMSTRQCDFGECYKLQQLPQIREHKGTFIQIKRTKKIQLLVGETAILLPNQAVKIRCPVRNFHKKLIFWSKDHRIIPLVGRVRVSSNGALRITRANAKDAGVYTCSAGTLHSTIKVTFHSKREAKAKQADILDTIFVENFNYSSKFASDSFNGSVINRPQSDTNFKMKNTNYFRVNSIKDNNGYDYSSFTTTDWTSCSEKCGWGTQTRSVTCNHVTDKYIRLLPEEECLKQGLLRPLSSRKCILEEECAKWVTSNWTKCSVENCRKEGYSVQTRSVTCQYKNGTVVSPDKCLQGAAGSQPPGKQHCKNPECVAVWTTSKWSECSPACGENGKKYRTLRCEWVTTNAPALFACREKARPSVSKSCKLPPCSIDSCEDKSSYCQRIERLKMCRYTVFRRKCCKSCRYANIRWP